jgi:hypothetical protein
MFEQQSLARVQLLPCARQLEQTPALQSSPTQQSPAVLQCCWLAAQVVQT